MGVLGAALKANPWGAIATGIGGLLGIGKAVVGGIQTARANKNFNNLIANRPMYEIPKEYQDVLSTYQRLSQGQMPGQDILESRIGQATAGATQAAERGAVSSTAYQGAVGNIYQKELEALQNLGVQSEQYKSQMTDKASQAQLGLGEQKAQQWNVNQYVPWQTELNRWGEKANVGQQNLYAGFGDIGSSLSNFAGTNALLEMYKKMYPKT